MNRSKTQLLASVTLLLTLLFSQHGFAQPTSVSLPGTFQTAIGCPGNWQPECTLTNLTKTSEGIWEGTFFIPAGTYEYKVAYDGTWKENYGLYGLRDGQNILLFRPYPAFVRFVFYETSHIVLDMDAPPPPPPYAVVLAGDFQSKLGCPGDWDPACDATRLTYSDAYNTWYGLFEIPAGEWHYKVTINNSWNENYGLGGIRGGADIPLSVAEGDKVLFRDNPQNHIVTTSVIRSVTLVGSFQSEGGCVGDWDLTCKATELVYDPVKKGWSGTLDLPAGYWEYKVAQNNTWSESFGKGGSAEPYNNIELNLETAANMTFTYDPLSHVVSLVYNTTGLCATAFYDANANGLREPYENIPMAGVPITLSNSTTLTQNTYSDGRTCFTGLTPGKYTLTQTVPEGYLPTVEAQTYDLAAPVTLNFGLVCLGGTGAREVSFWMNKPGQALFSSLDAWTQGNILAGLNGLNLRDVMGNPVTFNDYAALRAWMQRANAKNMAYKLSAQLAALYLNIRTGLVEDSTRIYIGGVLYGRGVANALAVKPGLNFIPVGVLIGSMSALLGEVPSSVGGDAIRPIVELFTELLEQVNGDQIFVQKQPCGGATMPMTNKVEASGSERVGAKGAAVIWPNPSGTYFHLRPAQLAGSGELLLRVLDVDGKLVYTATGSAAKEYRFGEGFKPGLYFVEITQGDYRSTIKVVKQ